MAKSTDKKKSARAADPAADHRSVRGPPASTSATFPLVGVGASAGGLESFVELLRGIPTDAAMSFVLVQHLDPTHPSYLSEVIARSTALPVHEITDDMEVEPGHVYIIPSHADVGILRGRLALLPRTSDERKPHLPIDFFFKALAADFGSRAIGVVLSGTGADGSEGLRAIKGEGGLTFAQEPHSAKFSAMPEAAIKTGAVDFVLAAPELADELLRLARHPFLRHTGELLSSPADDNELKKALVLLRQAVGIDYTEHKVTTVRRRLARRMALRRLSTLDEYVRLLRDDPAEVKALSDDILIHVTSFFRDPEAFERLKEHVFPEILRQKRKEGAIRIWSAGCSTGEEAYSLVIALLEFLADQSASDVPIQLFGTDIGEKAIAKARIGLYSDAAMRDVGPERLARFFTTVEGGGYSIGKRVRERCAFVKHDLASDPPFSKIDLIACRNVLIYFERELQKRVLATFHFALNDPGFLFLGRAENVAEGSNLFRSVDKDNKIFARTQVKSTLLLIPARDTLPLAPRPAESRAPPIVDPVRRAESVLNDVYVPPGVVVDDRMQILNFRGRTGPYLEPAPGPPQNDLAKMARKGLVADLRIAIAQAKERRTTVRRRGVRFEHDGASRVCDIVVIPVAAPPETRDAVFAVLFEEAGPPDLTAAPAGTASASAGHAGLERGSESTLASELEATKEYLQSTIAEHQHGIEELQSVNEDLISSNEELQSLNEELQTAKEELQSTNEELATLNEELENRNNEVNSTNSDLVNILGSVEVPIVIVDGARKIKRFTPKARPILNLLPGDVGRPIDDIKPNLFVDDLDRKIAEVIELVHPHEEEARGRDGRWYRLQIRPYTTIDKRIDGAVLSIVDVDVLKRALGAAEWARDYARATVEAIQTPIVVLDEKLAIMSANSAFDERYGISREESDGRSFNEILERAFDRPELQAALAQSLERSEPFEKRDLEIDVPKLGRRIVSLSARSVRLPSRENLLLVAVDDVTERRRAEAERERLLHETEVARASAEAANRTKDVFLATLSHELRTPLSALLFQAAALRKGKKDEAALQKAASIIERATRTQAQLIDDLLDISRIVSGKLSMEVQPVRLPSVVKDAVEIVDASAAQKHVTIDLHADESLAPLAADPLRVHQVVVNLLSNAVKFTPDGGHVDVTVDRVDGHARVRVTDTGVGIEPGFLPHVWDRFAQETPGPARTTTGGLGLGLAIARHVVEAHGGTVEAVSEGKGKGSTFTVLFPIAKAN